MNTSRLLGLILSVAMACGLLASTSAAQKRDVAPAPTPTQITSGKKVFVSNAGGDTNNLYSGGAGRLYNQFYDTMKSWGRYQLVGSPAEADLVFEIRFRNPLIEQRVWGGGGNTPVNGAAVTDPQFRVTVLDPGTRMTLWVFTEHIERALLAGNRDKNFDEAFDRLVNNIKSIVVPPGGESAKK